jgi:hypothetical protein
VAVGKPSLMLRINPFGSVEAVQGFVHICLIFPFFSERICFTLQMFGVWIR